jgi:hypothetical protein
MHSIDASNINWSLWSSLPLIISVFCICCFSFDNSCSRIIITFSKIFADVWNCIRPDARRGIIVALSEAQLVRVVYNDVAITRSTPELNAILFINVRFFTAWKGIRESTATISKTIRSVFVTHETINERLERNRVDAIEVLFFVISQVVGKEHTIQVISRPRWTSIAV